MTPAPNPPPTLEMHNTQGSPASDTARRHRRWRVAAWIAMLLALLGELVFTGRVITGRPSDIALVATLEALLPASLGILLWHGVAALLAVAAMRIPVSSDADPVTVTSDGVPMPDVPPAEEQARRWARLAAPIALFVPFFGVPTLAFVFGWRGRSEAAPSRIYDVYKEYIEYRIDPKPFFAAVDPDEKALETLAIEPITDLLTDRDKATTRGSIEVLSRFAHDDAVGLIRRTLDDPDVDIKFYSSWGLDRIEERYAAEIRARRDELTADSSRERALALVRAVQRYMMSGLEDTWMLQSHATECRDVLTRLLATAPEDAEAAALLARNDALIGNASAIDGFARLERRHALPSEFLLDYAEALWRAGRQEETARVMRGFAAVPANSEHLRQRAVEIDLAALAEFWGPAA